MNTKLANVFATSLTVTVIATTVVFSTWTKMFIPLPFMNKINLHFQCQTFENLTTILYACKCLLFTCKFFHSLSERWHIRIFPFGKVKMRRVMKLTIMGGKSMMKRKILFSFWPNYVAIWLYSLTKCSIMMANREMYTIERKPETHWTFHATNHIRNILQSLNLT